MKILHWQRNFNMFEKLLAQHTLSRNSDLIMVKDSPLYIIITPSKIRGKFIFNASQHIMSKTVDANRRKLG